MHLFSVFSLRNRALIALVTIVIGVFGGISLTSLKQELIPSLSLPQIFIITSYPGASPAVVDKDVSTPIEAAIQGVAGLESSSSTSSANVSSITAAFTYGTNIATAEQKVQLAINRLSTLPDGAETQVLTFNFSDLPVIQIAVSSDMNTDDLSKDESVRIDRIMNVNHPNLIPIIDYRLDRLPAYVILKFNKGTKLNDMMAGLPGGLGTEKAVQIVQKLTKALDILRKNNVRHANIRPSKIFIDLNGMPMISPLDIVKK